MRLGLGLRLRLLSRLGYGLRLGFARLRRRTARGLGGRLRHLRLATIPTRRVGVELEVAGLLREGGGG